MLLPFPNVVTVAKVVALAVLVLKSSEGTESEPTGNHNGKTVAVRLMVNVVALPWLSLIVVAPINGTALPWWYLNPRRESDPQQNSNRNVFALAASGTHGGKGIAANGEPSGQRVQRPCLGGVGTL